MPGRQEEGQTRAKFHPIFPQNEVFRRVRKKRARECQEGKKSVRQEQETAKESQIGELNCPESGPIKNLVANLRLALN